MDDWVKILVTAVVSSVSTAAVAEPLKDRLANKSKLKRLRRTLYEELAITYEDILDKQSHIHQNELEAEDRLTLLSDRYTAAQSDYTHYYQLDEALALSHLYSKLQQRVHVPTANASHKLASLEAAKQIIEHAVAKKPFSTTLFRKCQTRIRAQIQSKSVVS